VPCRCSSSIPNICVAASVTPEKHRELEKKRQEEKEKMKKAEEEQVCGCVV